MSVGRSSTHLLNVAAGCLPPRLTTRGAQFNIPPRIPCTVHVVPSFYAVQYNGNEWTRPAKTDIYDRSWRHSDARSCEVVLFRILNDVGVTWSSVLWSLRVSWWCHRDLQRRSEGEGKPCGVTCIPGLRWPLAGAGRRPRAPAPLHSSTHNLKWSQC